MTAALSSSRQRAERDVAPRRPRGPSLEQLRPADGTDQRGRVVDALEQRVDQVEQRRLRPVQILEREHERAPPREDLDSLRAAQKISCSGYCRADEAHGGGEALRDVTSSRRRQSRQLRLRLGEVVVVARCRPRRRRPRPAARR